MHIEYIYICCIAFFAGFMDAIVGGGGLIQTPAMLILFPQYPFATILGTIKIPSISGTSFAAYTYSKKVKLKIKPLIYIASIAFCGALLGSYSISFFHNSTLKPIILILLILVAIYTYSNKNFGIQKENKLSIQKQIIIGCLFGFIIGFYDGFIGPGTGTFFILLFITYLGCDFLTASANAKTLNVATNLASLIYLGSTGHILFRYAIPMAIFNVLGSFFGTKLALLKGNSFIRIFFLIIISATILKFGYDIFYN